MKKIPSIHQPIQKSDGSMEYVWYLFLQWVSENAGKVDLSDYFTKEETEELLAVKANTDDLADVAFSGNYNDLSNKPTIPTVGDGTITVKQGGVTKGTFTVNQSGDTEINIDEGGGTGDGITITENSDEELQAIGVINKNTETGATNPIYDWVGTEEEYEAQNIATLHPEWLCFITDDCENTEPVRTEVAERNMGELVYSTIPITDAGLHLADGELLDGTGIYADFYDYMVGVYNAGHTSIFCSEADWQTEIADHNMCGKYVLDTVNHTIRLPSIWGWVEGVRTESKAGTYVPPGLPNITGEYRNYGWNTSLFVDVETQGALYRSGTSRGIATTIGGSTGSTYKDGLSIDASRSSPVYGTQTADAVQPRGVQVLIYIVIANTVKTPIEVDIDNIATDLNNKVNKGHEVIEFLAPTVDNDYTWYRKYADGWVEQGGCYNSASGTVTVSFPVQMADNNYTILKTMQTNSTAAPARYFDFSFANKTTTSADTNTAGVGFSWQVSGMTA